jgi:hypothetical protein
MFLTDATAWEELAKVSECIESTVTFDIARAYAEAKDSSDESPLS